MFKLIELAIGNFAVVEENECGAMPMNVHGFIRVHEYPRGKYVAYVLHNVSKLLEESGELENLKAEAIETTVEAVADEFGD